MKFVARCVAALLLATLISTAPARADEASDQRSLTELRNTVVNLLQALVEKGLLTREQADLLVKQAQDKAAVDAAALAAKNAAQAKEDEGAVRVPYVPQIVKDEISKQVAAEVKPAVVEDVVQEAKEEKWGVPGALPEWLSRVRVFGDVTVREQSDWYPKDNSVDQIFDFNAINAAGGIANTTYPFLDTTEDRNRLRLRARFGIEGDISPYVSAVVRLASGSLTNPGSESQTLGNYGERYTVGIDQAYIRWNTSTAERLSAMTLEGGRIPNPWFAPTQLVYATDLTFEGVADTARFGWGDGGADRSHVYLTLGGFPVLEVPLDNPENKWLVGGQLGGNLRFRDGTDHLKLGLAYYDFVNVTGQKNSPDSTLLNFTAPAFIQYGNSVFDISNNSNNPNVNLFALAAHFRLIDLAGSLQHDFSRYSLALSGEAVRNVGYNLAQVEALTGETFAHPEDTGYVGELSFGDPVVERFGAWRAAIGYRYVKRDAVIDAWTDADFHEGGTNAAGYTLWGSYGLANRTWIRVRYMSGNEIDGPRYADDILQVDVNTRF